MLTLIAMFILGFIFCGCLVALFVIYNIYAENDRLDEMAKWYEEEYPNDEIR